MHGLLVAVGTLLVSAIAVAAPVNADPFGLELGVASIGQVQDKMKGNPLSESGTSAITGGRILVAENPDLGPEGLQKVLFIFDKQDKLVAVQMTLPKGFGGKKANEIAGQLATKYTQRSRSLPAVGNGSARYTRGASYVDIDSPHMSFEFTVSYMTEGFRQAMALSEQKKKQQADERTKSAL